MEQHLLWRREEDYFTARIYHVLANVNRPADKSPYPLTDLMIYKIPTAGEPEVSEVKDPIEGALQLRDAFKGYTDAHKRIAKRKNGGRNSGTVRTG